MEKLEYKTTLNAGAEKVWGILWGDETYKQWTAAFSEGSRAETDWKQGSKVLFLDASGHGMVSRIAQNIPNQYMSFEHLGVFKNGIEDLDSEEVKSWAGSHENYTLKPLGEKTELTVDMDIDPKHKEMFEQIWPKALAKLKELAEK